MIKLLRLGYYRSREIRERDSFVLQECCRLCCRLWYYSSDHFDLECHEMEERFRPEICLRRWHKSAMHPIGKQGNDRWTDAAKLWSLIHCDCCSVIWPETTPDSVNRLSINSSQNIIFLVGSKLQQKPIWIYPKRWSFFLMRCVFATYGLPEIAPRSCLDHENEKECDTKHTHTSNDSDQTIQSRNSVEGLLRLRWASINDCAAEAPLGEFSQKFRVQCMFCYVYIFDTQAILTSYWSTSK